MRGPDLYTSETNSVVRELAQPIERILRDCERLQKMLADIYRQDIIARNIHPARFNDPHAGHLMRQFRDIQQENPSEGAANMRLLRAARLNQTLRNMVYAVDGNPGDHIMDTLGYSAMKNEILRQQEANRQRAR